MTFENVECCILQPKLIFSMLTDWTFWVFLTAKIQSMKNGVPKNDKKRRKQMTEEIAKMEAELDHKHDEELRQLVSTSDTRVRH